MRVREAPQHHRLDSTENGGRGADAERKRENRHRGKAGSLGELAERETHVVRQLREVFCLPHFSLRLMCELPALGGDALEVTEAREREPADVGRIRPPCSEVAFAHRQVKVEFRGDEIVGARLPESIPRAAAGAAGLVPRHAPLRAGVSCCNTPITTLANDFHSAVSVRSCFRPTGVRR
jgi:hypothetical protein